VIHWSIEGIQETDLIISPLIARNRINLIDDIGECSSDGLILPDHIDPIDTALQVGGGKLTEKRVAWPTLLTPTGLS
jgi:hypothetical protein